MSSATTTGVAGHGIKCECTLCVIARLRWQHAADEARIEGLVEACKELLTFVHSVRPGGGVLRGEQEMIDNASAALAAAGERAS